MLHAVCTEGEEEEEKQKQKKKKKKKKNNNNKDQLTHTALIMALLPCFLLLHPTPLPSSDFDSMFTSM